MLNLNSKLIINILNNQGVCRDVNRNGITDEWNFNQEVIKWWREWNTSNNQTSAWYSAIQNIRTLEILWKLVYS